MTQVIESSVKPATMGFFKALAFPLRMLWVGNFLVGLYVLICAGGSIEIAIFLQNALTELANELLPDFAFLNYIESATYVFYILCIPFIAVGAGLPVRIMWLYDGCFIRPLILETRRCARRFVNILRFTMAYPVYALLPLAGMLVIQKLLKTHDIAEQVMLLITTGIVITLCVALYKLMEWLFLILLTTFVDVDEIFALQNVKLILRHKLPAVLFVEVFGFGATAALYFSKILNGNVFLPFIMGFMLWYTFCVLIVLALEAAEAHAQMNGVTLRIVHPTS